MQMTSMYIDQTAFPGCMHRDSKGNTSQLTASQSERGREYATYLERRSYNRLESTCASSAGAPGLNFGEHIAGKSKLGTSAHLSYARASSCWSQTYETVVGFVEFRLCDLSFDAADDGGVAEAYKRRSLCCINRA